MKIATACSPARRLTTACKPEPPEALPTSHHLTALHISRARIAVRILVWKTRPPPPRRASPRAARRGGARAAAACTMQILDEIAVAGRCTVGPPGIRPNGESRHHRPRPSNPRARHVLWAAVSWCDDADGHLTPCMKINISSYRTRSSSVHYMDRVLPNIVQY